MSWIEGVGDEVPIFFLLAFVVVILFMVLAWKSTNVPEPSTPVDEQLILSTAADGTPETIADLLIDGPPIQEPQPSTSSEQAENTEAEPKTDQQESQQEEVDTGSQIRRRILETTQAQEVIVIRLKYLDDTQRTVESTASTTLAEFKRTNFVTELSDNKVVKLIYNGQVLNNESQTLAQLGLENNCAVHCLIQQPRTTTTNNQSTNPSSSNFSNANDIPRRENSTAEAGVDIGGLLFPLLGVILGLVWYCRIAYATHFTAAATTVLVGLSGLCVLYVFVVWHPSMMTSDS